MFFLRSLWIQFIFFAAGSQHLRTGSADLAPSVRISSLISFPFLFFSRLIRTSEFPKPSDPDIFLTASDPPAATRNQTPPKDPAPKSSDLLLYGNHHLQLPVWQSASRGRRHANGSGARGQGHLMRVGCVLGTCQVQNLSHRLYQLIGQSGREESSPINLHSPHSYGWDHQPTTTTPDACIIQTSRPSEVPAMTKYQLMALVLIEIIMSSHILSSNLTVNKPGEENQFEQTSLSHDITDVWNVWLKVVKCFSNLPN